MNKIITFIKIEWFKIGLLVILFFAVYGYFSQNKAIPSGEYSMNEKCSKLAADFYEKTIPDPWEYTNHYNSSMNKCFILATSFNLTLGMKNFYLYDVIENKRYADYHWDMNDSQKSNCEIMLTGQECKSKVDFDEFVKGYMNN